MAQLWSCRFVGQDQRLAKGTSVTVQTSGSWVKPDINAITNACIQQLGTRNIPLNNWEISPM